MSLTNSGAKTWLDTLHTIFGATLHMGLSTTAPNADGSNFTEPVGNGYARASFTNALWNAATTADPSVRSNANTLTFPAASGGNWGTVTHFGIFTASSGGTAIWTGALTSSRAINDGSTASFAASALELRLT